MINFLFSMREFMKKALHFFLSDSNKNQLGYYLGRNLSDVNSVNFNTIDQTLLPFWFKHILSLHSPSSIWGFDGFLFDDQEDLLNNLENLCEKGLFVGKKKNSTNFWGLRFSRGEFQRDWYLWTDIKRNWLGKSKSWFSN